ncbi:hypothetical protein [Allonocardiopsis opalescens]|uniref:hypothetical protein n=1 Tax=Allonocardiopsis opalescens TaxID=1144618 RepID=UPI0011B21E4D|nr:hypothetical protein [Allonocardiopsis opalescens]
MSRRQPDWVTQRRRPAVRPSAPPDPRRGWLLLAVLAAAACYVVVDLFGVGALPMWASPRRLLNALLPGLGVLPLPLLALAALGVVRRYRLGRR